MRHELISSPQLERVMDLRAKRDELRARHARATARGDTKAASDYIRALDDLNRIIGRIVLSN